MSPTLRRSSLLAALLLVVTALPAFAVLSLSSSAQSRFDEFLGMIFVVQEPTAAQLNAQRKINRKTKKAFRSGRPLSKCINDIRKVIAAAGSEFDRETILRDGLEVDGSSLRTSLVSALLSEVRVLLGNAEANLEFEREEGRIEERDLDKLERLLERAEGEVGQTSPFDVLDADDDLRALNGFLNDFVKTAKELEKLERKAGKLDLSRSILDNPFDF